MKVVFKAIVFCAIGSVVAVTASGLCLLLWQGLNDDLSPSDVGIVLGSSITSEGQPSPRLQARLDRTGELWKAGRFSKIIVSGGIEPEGWDEAHIMGRYLEQHWHVPHAAILLDTTGNTTRDTACHSAILMRQYGWHSALIVSQYFHIARSRAALQQAGINEVHHAHAYFTEGRDFYSVAREIVALPVYQWRHAKECTVTQ